MSLNRVVALFTPVFTAVAGLASAYAAKHGLNLDPTEVAAVEALVATSAAGAALKWLHGSQAIDKYEAEAVRIEKLIAAEAAKAGVHFTPEEVEAKLQELIAKLSADVSGKAAAEKAVAKAEDDRSAAEVAAGTARTELATAQAQLSRVQNAIQPAHVRGDANLVQPVVADVMPNSVTQPETEVAADVAASSPAVVTQPPVAADVTDHAPISQVV
jgi:hypothetical protein